ncbi:hypothetical protein HWV62_29873 [Athelia sp. TMB]|nr:hypothetical protein HWV62_29873 [Athelia sp. TMB]
MEKFTDDVLPEKFGQEPAPGSLSDSDNYSLPASLSDHPPGDDAYFDNPWANHSSANGAFEPSDLREEQDTFGGNEPESEDEEAMDWEREEDDDDDDEDDDEAKDFVNGSQDSIPPPTRKEFHPTLTGRICDKNGVYIPDDSPPPLEPDNADDWGTFDNKIQFETGDFLFRKNQMSGGDIDTLMKLWSDSGATAPFQNHADLYNRIDSSTVGEAPWTDFSLAYDGKLPRKSEPPEWMTQEYQAWFRDPVQLIRNLVANPDFKDEFDYVPYHEYDENNKHRFQDFMSGDWAWRQADIITKDPRTHGAFLITAVAGSDKTTVSVGTGNIEYHPIYLSVGNIHNNTRRAHRNGVVLLGFLPIPKTSKENADDGAFRKFRRQLFHTAIARMLLALKPGMTDPIVMLCTDGHFRRAIFSLGPYIADYPEQCMLALVVQGWCAKCLAAGDDLENANALLRRKDHAQTIIEEFEILECWDNWGLVSDVVPFTDEFPRADIYELLAPDILHQLIKGVFKDHLVTWVNAYIFKVHGDKHGKKILTDIDRRIAIVAPFAGLRRFPQGRGFKQWTGDDSKALMKVYLPAIESYVPPDMIRAIRAFLEFCYIVRKNVIDIADLEQLQEALDRFHKYRKIFIDVGVREDFNLPRQHSMVHFPRLIRAFGAPNGLCSSITESKHIKAVKEPWRRSSRHNAIIQMMRTNTRLDKFAAMRVNFVRRGMLAPTSVPTTKRKEQEATEGHVDGDDSVPGPRTMASVQLAKVATAAKVDVQTLAEQICQPDLKPLIQQFLQEQLTPIDERLSSPTALPFFKETISTFPSAQAIFYAPSDICGTGGMRKERIRAVPSWYKGPARYDTVFVETDANAKGMRALDVARVRLFFSFTFRGIVYPCALVHWLQRVDEAPDEATGMWIVEPELDEDGNRLAAVLHLDTIVRAAHLIGVYGNTQIPRGILPAHSLDIFSSYYVNKFADHHTFEIAF